MNVKSFVINFMLVENKWSLSFQKLKLEFTQGTVKYD